MSRILAVMALGSASWVTGCIVLPLNADGTDAYPGIAPQASVMIAPPASQTLPVRLYPTNEAL